MRDTHLPPTVTNLITLVERHATTKSLVNTSNGLVDLEIHGTMEQVKYTMECFYNDD